MDRTSPLGGKTGAPSRVKPRFPGRREGSSGVRPAERPTARACENVRPGGTSGRRVCYGFGNVGLESPTLHAKSVHHVPVKPSTSWTLFYSNPGRCRRRGPPPGRSRERPTPRAPTRCGTRVHPKPPARSPRRATPASEKHNAMPSETVRLSAPAGVKPPDPLIHRRAAHAEAPRQLGLTVATALPLLDHPLFWVHHIRRFPRHKTFSIENVLCLKSVQDVLGLFCSVCVRIGPGDTARKNACATKAEAPRIVGRLFVPARGQKRPQVWAKRRPSPSLRNWNVSDRAIPATIAPLGTARSRS